MQVYGYCIFKNGERAELLYPKEGFDADVSGRSFTHGRFVQRLRHAAASAPGVTVRQGTVKRLVNGENLLKPNYYFVVIGLLYKASRRLPATPAEAKALPREGASVPVLQKPNASSM